MNDAVENAVQSAAEEKTTERLEKDLSAVKSDIAHLSQQMGIPFTDPALRKRWEPWVFQ